MYAILALYSVEGHIKKTLLTCGGKRGDNGRIPCHDSIKSINNCK